MGKDLVFTQAIDRAQIVPKQGIMSVCDLGQIDKETGGCEVIDQRDWNVPNFNVPALEHLCVHCECDDDCAKCIVTRLMEEI